MLFRFTRFYRAYPELNEYSDQECERMVWQAHTRRGDAMWIIPGAFVLLFVLVSVPIIFFAAWFARRLVPSVNPALSVAGLAFAVLIIGSGAVWIKARRVLVIRSVLLHLVRARCPYCQFSLVGLPVEGGGVTCPECGERVVLAEEGINPEDLMPGPGHPYRTWRPPSDPDADAPSIPLEPELPAQRRKIIHARGLKREEGR